MGAVKIIADWLRPFDIDSDRQIEIFIDKFSHTPIPEDTIRIILMQEPMSLALEDVINYQDCYTYVLTYYPEILNTNPKARYFMGMYPRVNPDIHYEKKFGVSTVVGWKNNPVYPGYAVRHKLWARQDEILIPHDFYRSEEWRFAGDENCKNPILPGRENAKEMMFDCMFHVAIENILMENSFTEKIIDCFLTRTIPIHYGTPNIGKFFNIEGVYEVATVNDIIATCNMLTPAIYQYKLDVVEENYNRALEYRDYNTHLKNTIMQLL